MKSRQKQPKVIFVDWNGTLSNSKFWEQLNDPVHDLHKLHSQLETWLFKEHYSLVDDWMLGKTSAEEICERIGEGINKKPQEIFRELTVSCKNMKLCDSRIPGILKRLKVAGIEIAIASDNMDVFRRFTIPALKLNQIFDGFLLSNEIGSYKYEARERKLPFFDNYLKTRKASYEDVVLLDDSEEKTGTFKNSGFEIIQTKTPGSLVAALNSLLPK